ncbi:MAG: LacI family transcriptional regulator [Clostridia bacterium]|nr:LacI family transcriptional regulator [Clostridia bacterium]NCC43064.1 LacI family transcriptional regulator [Clostridia bacterium]
MVADRAGVSRGTVDRVLNNRSYVKQEVRERILQAIEETGYLSPREKHSRTVVKTSETLLLGVLLPNWGGHFTSELMPGILAAEEELSEFGVKIMISECETDVPHEAIQKIDALISDGVSGLAVCARDDDLLKQHLLTLSKQIPVITFNSDLPDSGRLCFVGQDDRKSGRMAGELLGKCIRSGRIMAVCGNLEFDGHRKRLNGFCERVQELGIPNDRIEVIETYNDYQLTYRKVTEALQQHSDFSAIYLANESVPGCVDAVHDAGKEQTLRIIAHDVTPAIREYLQDGRLDFTISQDLYRQGHDPLILLRDFLQRDKEPNPDQTATEISIICAVNFETN